VFLLVYPLPENYTRPHVPKMHANLTLYPKRKHWRSRFYVWLPMLKGSSFLSTVRVNNNKSNRIRAQVQERARIHPQMAASKYTLMRKQALKRPSIRFRFISPARFGTYPTRSENYLVVWRQSKPCTRLTRSINKNKKRACTRDG
jgi:hypothetical protein